jgi:hypothetical protein
MTYHYVQLGWHPVPGDGFEVPRLQEPGLEVAVNDELPATAGFKVIC